LTFTQAIKDILEIGLPAIISMVLALVVEVINSIFVGHLGKEEILAGVGMANMYMNVTCLSLLFGMNMVLNTLGSQAHGFGDLRLCGIYLNHSRIIITIIFIPLAIMLMNTESIFDFIGFDPKASYYS
jgi:multidrug resistance protein, MATE family